MSCQNTKIPTGCFPTYPYSLSRPPTPSRPAAPGAGRDGRLGVCCVRNGRWARARVPSMPSDRDCAPYASRGAFRPRRRTAPRCAGCRRRAAPFSSLPRTLGGWPPIATSASHRGVGGWPRCMDDAQAAYATPRGQRSPIGRGSRTGQLRVPPPAPLACESSQARRGRNDRVCAMCAAWPCAAAR